ncbi:hypothetical protein E4U42_004901 [Claviceps africana]|uniref:Uncharacterized protein n=1 Tax=Claviceps africana TaxID=83212 RepID=A0A8K0NHV2_9HYPO|nr:hypothetical protein E4U42_004901 [Claviceps africana]
MSTTVRIGRKKTDLANSSLSIQTHQTQHEPPSSCRQKSPQTICGSVKSIVAWLESSSSSQQPWSPSTSVADMSHDASTSSVSTYHRKTRSRKRLSATSDEDCALTYLKYQDYFTSVPLRRCLDQTHEDDPRSAREWPTRKAAHVTEQEKGADACGHALVKRGRPGAEHAGELKTASFRPFILRDPDEVRAF